MSPPVGKLVRPSESDSMRGLALADQLKLLLSLPLDTPVYASSSFEGWLRSDDTPQWPPPRDAAAGLCLADTRDRAIRRSAAGWERLRSGVDHATLLITGSGPPGSPIRRVLRRIRRPGMQRVEERRIVPRLDGADIASVQRLFFRDGLEVPGEFDLEGDRRSTGVALLLTRKKAFSGRLWSVVAEQLNDPAFQLRCIQLRLRGATIIVVRSGDGDRVIRAVQPGPVQAVVLRNHAKLLELRASLSDPEILRLIPQPLFLEMYEGFALLGETFLQGVPAWQLPPDVKRQRTHPQALEFLAALAAETRKSPDAGLGALESHLCRDAKRVSQALFASAGVRELLQNELRMVAKALPLVRMETTTSHGDFGYGNLLTDPGSGALLGVIDWDTARQDDFPGVDRVNLEIQIRRSESNETFQEAVRSVWGDAGVQAVLRSDGDNLRNRALFGAAVTRYILRSLSYPAIFREEEPGFRAALEWLGTLSWPGEVRA